MLSVPIFTGQFSKIDLYLSKNMNVVSIARKKPVWFTGPELLELAPSLDLLQHYHAGLSFGAFSKEFLDYLETLDKESLFNSLELLGKDHKGVVLCCYEKAGRFCHRVLVSRFLGISLGQLVIEFP